MKNYIVVFIFSFTHLILLEQEKDGGLPISVGLYAPYVFQPGFKIGSTVNLNEWRRENHDKVKLRTLYVSPQFGVFTRSDNHTSFVLNSDLGYKIMKSKDSFYTAAALGVGYLLSNQILSSTIDLSTGDILAREREIQHYFLPTINFEFGKEKRQRSGWYAKLTYGRKVSSTFEDAGFFAVEFGLKFRIGKRTDEN